MSFSGELQEWLEERKLMTELLQQQLSRAQQRMKRQADKKRSECSFDIGDRVFLKLQPYVQSSVSRRANHKLSYKFYGPYSILARVGEVAYKLDLPPTSAIHPVVHVSQLRRALPPHHQVLSSLPTSTSPVQAPQAILDSRVKLSSNKKRRQVLVH